MRPTLQARHAYVRNRGFEPLKAYEANMMFLLRDNGEVLDYYYLIGKNPKQYLAVIARGDNVYVVTIAWDGTRNVIRGIEQMTMKYWEENYK